MTPYQNSTSGRFKKKVSCRQNLNLLSTNFSLHYFKAHQARFHYEPMYGFVTCTDHSKTHWVIQLFRYWHILFHTIPPSLPKKLPVLKSLQISRENHWSLGSCQAHSGKYKFFKHPIFPQKLDFIIDNKYYYFPGNDSSFSYFQGNTCRVCKSK